MSSSVRSMLRDVRICTREIEPLDKFDGWHRFLWKPSMNWIDEIWEELLDVDGQLGDDMALSKLLFANLVCFLSRSLLIEKPKSMDILMKKDMEDIWFQQRLIRFKNSTEWCFVQNDDVGGNRVIRSNETVE